MLKKLVLAAFGLVIAVGLAMPPKAEAQVAVGVQVGVPVIAFTSGYHEGYYYEDGYRYQ
jgi:ABC-type nitrate/sulfonate/bicarbonate transport system substrate-binding protein